MKSMNHVVSNFKESIFSTMTKMAIENKAINLSQGFPDFDGPKWVINLAKEALDEGHLGKNQYAPSMGILSLREAISANYKKLYHLDYSASSEILVTNGATEAIFCACLALLNPGDEVIVLEPFYDSYLAAIELAGAKIVPVTLKAPNFTYDINEIKEALTDKTKMLIINNPHNPSGKVYDKSELSELCQFACENDLYVMSDEVYEFLTFEKAHIPTATLENMKERTITISSTGKTFGLTGWKIGWVCSSETIISAIHKVHQFNVFCVAHPLQVAMARALEKMDEYIIEFKSEYKRKRDLLVNGLKDAGLNVLNPAGTYFALVMLPEGENDVDYCKKLIVENKVAVIPTSAFYLKSDEGKRIVRFCFAKQDETLLNALKNLK
ncbi:aminotransferase, class I/II [Bacteriovorax sp. BSW11_IV]|uniref:pyridoxal phosphate-dependent aminotransferase n=1 Tax=Bacteriovorax sp. BSW11_IV TaxID=1353529 RepID=UPI000389F0BB|nr:methionine aminotransferase [Bacteriovorax sp. BSW11_IV]EQC49953.1 aminotransferase, class I/II [Bacteriovorax sp. BSW11_IV]